MGYEDHEQILSPTEFSNDEEEGGRIGQRRRGCKNNARIINSGNSYVNVDAEAMAKAMANSEKKNRKSWDCEKEKEDDDCDCDY